MVTGSTAMKNATRYGRKLEIPPTAQIRRELRIFCAMEDARVRNATMHGLRRDAQWDEIQTAADLKSAAIPTLPTFGAAPP